MDQCRGEILFLADVPHVRGVRVLGQVKVKDGLFKQLHVRLPVKLDQTGQNVVRNDCLLKPSREDEGVQILKVPLFHACFREHLKEAPEQMVNGANSDAKLSRNAQRSLRNVRPLLELLNASIHILFQ